MSTQIMVSDIHRTVVKGREGGSDKNLLVSEPHTLFNTE
jgi:hypothetical protein